MGDRVFSDMALVSPLLADFARSNHGEGLCFHAAAAHTFVKGQSGNSSGYCSSRLMPCYCNLGNNAAVTLHHGKFVVQVQKVPPAWR